MNNFLKKGIVLATIVGTVLSSSVLAAGKTEYIKMEEKTLKNAVVEVEKICNSDITKILLPIVDKARKESDVEFELTTNDSENGEKKYNLTSKTTMDYDNNKEYFYIDFESKYNDEDLISFEASMDKNKVLLTIFELLDEYLYIDSNKIEEFNIEQQKSLELAKSLEFTDSEKKIIEKSFKNYYSVLKKSLPEDSFELKRNIDVISDNEKIQCNMVELNLSGEDIETIIINLLEEVKKDEKLLNLLLAKFDKFLDAYDEEEITIYASLINKEMICTYIDNYIAYLNSDEPIKDSIFIVRNYFDKNYNVLQRDFVDPYTGDMYLSLTTIPNKFYGVKYFETRYEYETEYIYNEYWEDYYPSRTRKEIREEVDLNVVILEEGNKTHYLIDWGNWQEGPEVKCTLDKDKKIFSVESLINGTEFQLETRLYKQQGKRGLETNINVWADEFHLFTYMNDSIQQNVTMNKINTKNKKDISNYSQEEIMNLLQTMGEKAVEVGLDDEEKIMAASIAVMTSFPEMRTLGAPMLITVYIPTVNSIKAVRNDIERMHEVRDLQTGLYD